MPLRQGAPLVESDLQVTAPRGQQWQPGQFYWCPGICASRSSRCNSAMLTRHPRETFRPRTLPPRNQRRKVSGWTRRRAAHSDGNNNESLITFVTVFMAHIVVRDCFGLNWNVKNRSAARFDAVNPLHCNALRRFWRARFDGVRGIKRLQREKLSR